MPEHDRIIPTRGYARSTEQADHLAYHVKIFRSALDGPAACSRAAHKQR